MDKLSLERIETLHPIHRDVARKAYIEANNALGKYVRLRISYALRSWEVQKALFAQSRETLGEVNRLRKIAGLPPITAKENRLTVTDARPGDSYHQYGLAFDIVLLYDNDKNGSFEEASWNTTRDGDADNIADWLEVTKVLENYGYQNGFIRNGKKWDLPHFQVTYGLSVRQLKDKYTKGDFIPGTNFVKI